MQQARNTVHADSSWTPGCAGVKGSKDRRVMEVLSCACLPKNAARLQSESPALTFHWNETEKTDDLFYYLSICSILEQKHNFENNFQNDFLGLRCQRGFRPVRVLPASALDSFQVLQVQRHIGFHLGWGMQV